MTISWIRSFNLNFEPLTAKRRLSKVTKEGLRRSPCESKMEIFTSAKATTETFTILNENILKKRRTYYTYSGTDTSRRG